MVPPNDGMVPMIVFKWLVFISVTAPILLLGFFLWPFSAEWWPFHDDSESSD